MKDIELDHIAIFRACADANRLAIVQMLSREELYAGKILDRIDITQPTLSHHMKILCDCGLVTSRRKGKLTYYSLDDAAVNAFNAFYGTIMSNKAKYVSADDVLTSAPQKRRYLFGEKYFIILIVLCIVAGVIIGKQF